MSASDNNGNNSDLSPNASAAAHEDAAPSSYGTTTVTNIDNGSHDTNNIHSNIHNESSSILPPNADGMIVAAVAAATTTTAVASETTINNIANSIASVGAPTATTIVPPPAQQQEQQQEQQQASSFPLRAVGVKQEDEGLEHHQQRYHHPNGTNADNDNNDQDDDEMEVEEAYPHTNLALDVLIDIIEYSSEMIFMDRENRREHKKCLEFFWKLYPAKNITFGRLYARRRLAQLFMDMCGEHPYHTSSSTSDEGSILVKWDKARWIDFIEQLKDCKTLWLRKDTRAALRGYTPHDNYNPYHAPRTEKRRKDTEIFGRKFDILLKCCQIQVALAPIRWKVEQQLNVALQEDGGNATMKTNPPVLEEEELQEFVESVRMIECKETRESIDSLFNDASSNEDGSRTLKTLEELAFILRAKPFDLVWLQSKMEALSLSWNAEVLGRDDPALIKVRYRIRHGSELASIVRLPKAARRTILPHTTATAARRPSSTHAEHDDSGGGGGPHSNDPQHATVDAEGEPNDKSTTVDGDAEANAAAAAAASKPTASELEELRKGRNNLGSEHGEDPIEASREIAKEAVEGRKKRSASDGNDDPDSTGNDEDGDDESGRSSKRKKMRLTFLEEVDHDDVEDEQKRIKLSELPAKAKSPLPKTYAGPPPDAGVFDKDGRVVKRRKWTDEEKNAVKAGVRVYGIGKWVEIKSAYADILRNRTAVQIKDVWRTMTKTKEHLEEPPPEVTEAGMAAAAAAAAADAGGTTTATTTTEGEEQQEDDDDEAAAAEPVLDKVERVENV